MSKIKLLIAVIITTVSLTAKADMLDDLFGLSSAPENKCDNNICNIYLLDEIKGPDSYRDVYKTLIERKPGDTVYIHLAGPGGQGDGLIYLLNAIRNSKAHTIAVIDGSVASCDAVLAISTNETVFSGDAYVFFHTISTSHMAEDICREQTGSDRGLAAYTKCVEDMPKITDFYNKVINRYVYKILTPQERVDYNNGHDIIIDNEELTKRLHK